MAVPADLTTKDLSGKFTLNRSLSGDSANMLELQGVSWIKRKVINAASITIKVQHTRSEDGLETLVVEQGNADERDLNWTEKATNHPAFGHIVGKARRIKLEELDVPFLKEGWTSDTLENGVINWYVQSDPTKGDTVWITNQTWGIEEIDGVRRYVRHVKFTGPKGEDIESKMVYDYAGPL
ncbi:hypothetical protein FISHEDRAFT_60894 [Fistulina hepatica ATCC 64428]|uniref:LCCL domain-containing protein n=1 Tax=Fistulina hepatica ATCC 64428 TaxID=1128425 RepID=A0A0D7A4T7_9AGAR|nr:hypothetical protein FISHEDRAFT_60894 [Fistulina hepatica ATCC 64428]